LHLLFFSGIAYTSCVLVIGAFSLVREIRAGVDYLRDGANRDVKYLRDGMSDEGKHIRESSKAETEYLRNEIRSTADVTRSLR
jgi:hypothetical protein